MVAMDIYEAEKLYDKYLDELGVANLKLPPASRVLELVDPVQYNVGLADFCSNNDIRLDFNK